MSSGEQSTYSELADVIDNLPIIVREARRAHRLSMRGAARQIGCAPSTISRLDAGVSSPHIVAILRWLDQPAVPAATEGRHDAQPPTDEETLA